MRALLIALALWAGAAPSMADTWGADLDDPWVIDQWPPPQVHLEVDAYCTTWIGAQSAARAIAAGDDMLLDYLFGPPQFNGVCRRFTDEEGGRPQFLDLHLVNFVSGTAIAVYSAYPDGVHPFLTGDCAEACLFTLYQDPRD